MATKKLPLKSATRGSAKGKASAGFTEDELAAMKDRAQELKAEERGGSRAKDADGEADVLAKISGMPEKDRILAERIHALVRTTAPTLTPKTWYGMPAYARDGNVILYFQSAHKFKARYATLGFSDKANLDEGNIWPVVFALKDLTAADEKRIAAILKQALSR